jgi:6-phosphogluconolactonase
MRVDVCATATEASQHAAQLIAEAMRAAARERGRAAAAVSGGTTPGAMLQALASSDLPWDVAHLFQVDERIVPDGDARRNLIGIERAFAGSPLPLGHLHPMPVGRVPISSGAAQYCRDLEAVLGDPPRLDVVHLGLGADGHTASLVPGDAALDAKTDVAISGPYEGTRRMTLTLRVIDRARRVVWLVTGAAKRDVVQRFLAEDAQLNASRVRRDAAVLVVDRAAAGE